MGDTEIPRRSTRDWVVDTAFFVLAASLGPLARVLLGLDSSLPSPLSVLDVVFGAMACLSLWWRRRWPTRLAIALILVGLVSPATDPPAAAMLFTVAVHRGGRAVARIAALNLATPLIRYFVVPDLRYPWWVPALLTVFGTAVLVGWGLWVRARRQLLLSLAERARRAEAEQQLRVEQARRNERTQIAREMHDVLAHRISLLSMHAGALEFRPDAPTEDVARAAGVIRSSAHQVLHDLRDVLGVLREGELDEAPERPQPELDDLPELIEQARRAGMRISWDGHVESPDDMPVTIGRNAYRIVQEALTNARKHAPGAEVRLSIRGTPGCGLNIEARNDIPDTVSVIPGTGTGLIGLSERASVAGGLLEHGEADGAEFRLRAWLPWPT